MPTRRLTGRRPIAAAVAILIAGGTLGVPRAARAADPAAQAAGELAAEHGGAASDYSVVYERSAVVRGTGESLWAAKLADRSGQLFTVYRDAGGQMGDAALFDGRVQAHRESLPPLTGKADEALRSRVESAAPGEDVPVAVWMTADASAAVAAVVAAHPEIEWIAGSPVIGDLATARALRGELYEARASVYTAAAEALRIEAERLGGTMAYASPAAPIAFVDIDAGAADELAALPVVETLGLERTWTPAMTSAGPTVDANWTSSSGDQGNGVRVAVVEYHNVRETGDLAGKVVAAHSATGTLAYASGSTFDHPTWVAGAIAGGGSYPGVAPGSRIVTASTGGGAGGLTRDRRVIATTDWAISPGGGDADIVSLSLIQDTSQGAEEARRYFDSVVDEDLRLVVAASGNYSAGATWRVGSPGTGWNVLTVGGNDDRGTASRSDDRHWYVPGADGSSYLDPPGTSWNAHGDFNKPNLSAPAVSVRTSNGLGGTGTSVATPIVSGIAAQLIGRGPGLVAWPEAMRAILTAGAVYHTRMPNGAIDADHEGTGSASALWSNRIMAVGDGTYGGYRFGGASGTFSQQIHVAGGQRVRVALSWNSRTSGSSNVAKTDTLASDFDLRLRLPNGDVAGSFTFDNTYEVIDVVSPTPGTATIEVVGTRVASGGERYGLAWVKIGGDITPPRVVYRAPESGEPWAAGRTRVTMTFSEPMTGLTSSSVRLLRAGGGPAIAKSLSYSAASRRLTLAPVGPLAPGGYVVSLSNAISDHAANRLPTQSWAFTVVDSVDSWSSALSSTARVTFSSGSHTGYRFSSDGSVMGSRTGTLAATSGAHTDRRGVIAGQPGRWLRIVDGMWAGHWIRESSRAKLRGVAESGSLASTTRITFTAGSHVGYRYSSSGSVTAARRVTLGDSSGANVSARAVINGAWHLYVTNGVWAGYWMPETYRSYVRGALDHRDMASRTVRFSAGTYTGARFTAAGGVPGTRTGTLSSSSSAPAISWAVINGAPRFLIGAGTWSGTWVSESTRIRSP